MKKRQWLVTILVSITALAAVTLVINNFMVEKNSVDSSTPTLEKGAQLLLPPIGSPLATGPAEPDPTQSPANTLLTTDPNPVTPNSLATSIATLLPTPSPEQGIIPRKIKIPAINVDTFVEKVGVTRDGNMDVPQNIWNVGWFGEGGYKPGSPGNAVIAGHLDAPSTRAVFWDLDKLKRGDKIILSDLTGRSLTFEVTNSHIYPYNAAPLMAIFGPSPEPHLNLITCGGIFDPTTYNYNKRLVVFSRLSIT
ncbi:MAG: class F sortase [Chloroflexi bacterium]|nr:class F sortase [Chloroflexota bacterium]